MPIASIWFAAGVLLLQCSASLLPVWAQCLLLLLALALSCCAWKGMLGPPWLAMAAPLALCGYLWAGFYAHVRLADRLSGALEGQVVSVEGRIDGLVLGREDLRFEFLPTARPDLPDRLALSWYGVPARQPKAGERWRFTVKLRRPRGNRLPHVRDQAYVLLERGIGASGYVLSGQGLATSDGTLSSVVDATRGALRARLQERLPDDPASGVLLALAVGDQSGLSQDSWRVLRDTGTAHLVSVSGLHVGLFAALGGWLGSWCWSRRSRHLLRWPASTVGMLAAVLAGGAYALLAGFALPAQRAWLMLCVIAAAQLLRRRWPPGSALGWALLLILLWDPFAVLSAGFWLSFGAMAVIAHLLHGRHMGEGRLRQGLRLQWGLSLVMFPLLILLFGRAPLISPLANAVAIPFVSLLLAPLALCCLFSPWDLPLYGAHALAGALLYALSRMAEWPWAVWQQAVPPWWLALIATTGLAWALLPRATPGRWLVFLLLPPALLWRAARPAEGGVWIRVLDVGQGLAVHLRTARHDYLYDAGPAWRHGDAGHSLILPYLHGEGVSQLAGLILSHDDSDHTGGAGAILGELPVAQLWTSLSPDSPRLAARQVGTRMSRCVAGQHWAEDGVDFSMLAPLPDDYGRALPDNRMSCVVRVQANGYVVLLPGDLDAAGEAAILSRDAAEVRSDVVVAGHHGSKNSSSPAWVAATRGAQAIFAAGYRNHFGHPAPVIEARWQAAGSRNWRTDLQGSVYVQLDRDGMRVSAERDLHPHYWDVP